jgi:hypothetical protein
MNVIGRATGHGYFINGDTHIGWRTQQLQKLLLAYNFEDDYLLLDSKNFFIKKCNILDWDNMIGSGKCLPIDLEGHAYYQTAQVYKEILDSNVTHYFHPITPFKIVRKNIVSNIKLSELGYLLFYPEHAIKPPHISEGVLYGFFLSEEEKINMTSGQNKALFNKYLGLWSHHSGEILKLVTESTRDIYVIAGVHRTLLNSMTHDDLKILNHWVSSLDLTNKITPLPYN